LNPTAKLPTAPPPPEGNLHSLPGHVPFAGQFRPPFPGYQEVIPGETYQSTVPGQTVTISAVPVPVNSVYPVQSTGPVSQRNPGFVRLVFTRNPTGLNSAQMRTRRNGRLGLAFVIFFILIPVIVSMTRKKR